MKSNFLIRFSAVCFSLLFTGKAWAQFPQGIKSGASPQSSSALTTLSIPLVVGVNTGHNFVLDFTSGTKCWGASGSGTYPQSVVAVTTYTFAVSVTSIPSSSPVGCPGAGAQPDVATFQVFSTLPVNSRILASISDGGQGGAATKFSDVIADIFTANRLQLAIPVGDTCGGGVKVSPFNLQVAAANQVTAIPKTGWSNCSQTLELTLAGFTIVTAGSATGTLTYTMVSP